MAELLGSMCLVSRLLKSGIACIRLYNEHPDRFACLVSIASAPSGILVPTLKQDLKILMVNGKRDSGFKIAGVESIASKLAERMPHFQIHLVDGDHFFLLSKREETFRTIKAFLDAR